MPWGGQPTIPNLCKWARSAMDLRRELPATMVWVGLFWFLFLLFILQYTTHLGKRKGWAKINRSEYPTKTRVKWVFEKNYKWLDSHCPTRQMAWGVRPARRTLSKKSYHTRRRSSNWMSRKPNATATNRLYWYVFIFNWVPLLYLLVSLIVLTTLLPRP